MMASQRARYACAACTRRKVKCSKTVPCTNCIRRGEADTCSSDAAAASPGRPQSRQADISHHEIELLRSRIVDLEAELHRGRAHTDPPPPSAMQTAPPNMWDSTVDPRLSSREAREARNHERAEQTAETTDAGMKNAASILEFLAWGRRMNPDYNIGVSPEATAHDDPSGDVRDASDDTSFPHIMDENSSISTLQLLLPSKQQVWALVQYHEESLLWYHCSYYAPSFRSQLETFYQPRFNGLLESRGINLQWVALLFAVLTGSITCAPAHQAQAWGFRPRERESLSKRWFRAVHTCLNAGEYAANPSILSVQAISTSTISAHLLGFSNIHSIYLAAVIRIAQGLGLHRISRDSRVASADRECGLRLWSQLCSQDWFGIPFSDTYLINPSYSQSDEPMNTHDHEMRALPDDVPTIISYCRVLQRIASIMPLLQDELVACNTPYTRYEQVIKWDKRMRALSTARPVFFMNMPIDPSWPAWVSWGRRSLAITSAHKIIMIHRSFLSDSFTNPAFSFTRRTCLAASKTIIKEYRQAADENEPVFWIYQAFGIAASIILILDMLHRSPTEAAYGEHKSLAEDAVHLLRQCQNSMIASRGIKLLSALLAEISDAERSGESRKRRHDGSPQSPYQMRKPDFDVQAFVKAFCGGRQMSNSNATALTAGEGSTAWPGQIDGSYVEPAPLDLLGGNDASYLTGFDSSAPFENLLYIASHDFV